MSSGVDNVQITARHTRPMHARPATISARGNCEKKTRQEGVLKNVVLQPATSLQHYGILNINTRTRTRIIRVGDNSDADVGETRVLQRCALYEYLYPSQVPSLSVE